MKTTNRQGFTLVEIVIALVILTVAVLSVSVSATKMSSSALTAERGAAARQATDDRMSRVLLHPTYPELDSLFDTVEDSVTEYGFRRSTDVDRRRIELDDGAILDYTQITVTVEGPLLGDAVSRTAAVGAP